MSSTTGLVDTPRITIASKPVRLPAIAKWLEASASVSIPVRGDFATTANLALVVRGVPTSGENTKARGASAANGSTPAGARWCMSHVPSPAPPRYAAEHGLGELDWRRRAGADVHEGGDAEVAGRRLLAQSVERRRVHPPASALTSETRSPVASGSSGSRLI